MRPQRRRADRSKTSRARSVALQQQRQQAPGRAGATGQIHDRSPLCTLALVHYLDRPVTPTLRAEIDRLLTARVYERTVCLVGPLGFVRPTPARRISYADSLTFQAVHEAVYRDHGFTLLEVPAALPGDRADLVESVIRRLAGA